MRNSRLRTKIIALLTSLVALWVFAAWVTLREGVNLLWVSSLNSNVAQPIVDLQPELQRERQLSLILLGFPGAQQQATLNAQRLRTDNAVAKFRKEAQAERVKLAEDKTLKQAIAAGLDRLSQLPQDRAKVDSGAIGFDATQNAYSTTIESLFAVDDSLASLDDKKFAKDVRVSLQLNRAVEVVSQENALVSGILAAGRLTRNEYLQLVQVIGAQRYTFGKALEAVRGSDHTTYEVLTSDGPFTRLRTLENTLLNKSRLNQHPPITSDQWRAIADPTTTQLSKAVFDYGDRLVDSATPIAIGVVVRLVLAGGLGLLAVIASIVVSITTARDLMRQLEKLRIAARELADKRLPGVVERLGRGEKVDVATEAPPLRFGEDEVGQVGHAFNSVQETAIRTAVEQAELRRGIRDILLSLARRSQALVHRQLTLLDTMERRQDDSAELEDLFHVDHLATRMRRNAENLIVLSGATPARGWRRPVPMIDVVRSAVAEVEDYTRVTVMPMGDVALAGRAVGDIVHLLAELIENAVSFSPPYTQAQVSGHMVAHGYAVEIEDRGLGMTDEILADINERVTDPPEFNLSSSAHLGLYVVGRLAMRYDVKVSLKHSSYGGTTAVVLIPHELVVEGADKEGEAGAAARSVPVGVAAGGMTATSYGDVPARVTEATVLEPPALPSPAQPSGPAPARPSTPAPAEATGPASEPSAAAEPAADEPGTLPPLPRRTSTTSREPERAEPTGSQATGPTPTPASQTTPGGLPVRVPQASISPALRTDGPTSSSASAAAPPDDGPTPEEIRKSFGGLQAGTRRGRTDAAARSLTDATDDTSTPAEDAQEDNQ
ncbi:nitrate- and nitrite sensing domain-containing protein [Actinoallomurus oryzae]|uniref:sensor histidine kinase n=1 Tax=Actinoallomurus oryzae TaxID=502180 RepID=UPI003CD099CE